MHILIILILLKIQLETPTKLCAQNHYTNVKISMYQPLHHVQINNISYKVQQAVVFTQFFYSVYNN